jgi:RNA polymerase sigma factor
LRELDSLVISAKSDQLVLEKIIKQNEAIILKCTSRVTHRYITKSDDEWSIALFAFTQAIESYDLEKGSFLSFADLVMKRRLIDYIKSQGKFSPEVNVDPVVFDTEPEEEDEDLAIKLAVAEQVSKRDNKDLKYEIEAANTCFSAYGFSFFDLSECSPHAGKTKKACAKAINYVMSNPMLLSELKSSKQLPLKIIENNCKIPRKILERHRKYIIAAIELLHGEYPNLAEYLRYIREVNEL